MKWPFGALGRVLALASALVVVLGIGVLAAPLRPLEQDPVVSQARERFEVDLMDYRQQPIPFDTLPTLRAAIPAYEDRAFDDRPSWVPPVSPTGIARALVRNLQGVSEGGSTIPQQLAKLYLRGEGAPGLWDKAYEALFATWIVRQMSRDELAGLYLNLSLGRYLSGGRDATQGAERLSLAVFGLPLSRLSREDQLLLASLPRGLGWMRRSSTGGGRVLTARRWLADHGAWDERVPSWLLEGDPPDLGTLLDLNGAWRERLASAEAQATDYDLVTSVQSFREGLSEALRSDFPTANVRAAFTVVGAGGRILVRSGSESAAMRLNYGSIAKLEPLWAAVDLLGVQAVRDFELSPTRCVRWFWSESQRAADLHGQWCPKDAANADQSLGLDSAVARSINTTTAAHVAALPYRIWRVDPHFVAGLTDPEPEALDSEADRAIAAQLLKLVGAPVPVEQVPESMSYSRLQVGWFRYLNQRRENHGLPAVRLPLDPTQTVGNSSRATLEEVARYVHRSLLLEEPGQCALSDVGALLAERRDEGTVRWLAMRHPKLVFAGKTGSSPHDDAALAAVAICLDGRPVVVAGAIRPVAGALPDGLHGSLVLRGIHRWMETMEALDRPVSSPTMPDWARPDDLEDASAAPDSATAVATLEVVR